MEHQKTVYTVCFTRGSAVITIESKEKDASLKSHQFTSCHCLQTASTEWPACVNTELVNKPSGSTRVHRASDPTHSPEKETQLLAENREGR